MYDQELVALYFACVHLSHYLSSRLHFTLLTDCSALHGLEKIDITTVQADRTLRCLERILSNNVSVVHFSSPFNKEAYYLSCHPSGMPRFPDIEKYTRYQQRNYVVNLVIRNHYKESLGVSVDHHSQSASINHVGVSDNHNQQSTGVRSNHNQQSSEGGSYHNQQSTSINMVFDSFMVDLQSADLTIKVINSYNSFVH